MNTRITGGILFKKQEMNRQITVNSVYDRFSDTGRIEALKMNWREGMPNKPHIFWDSDVAKWLEGACYILMRNPDDKLREKVENIIDDIIRNQGEDGYFNVYFTVVDPAARYTDLDNHELYCAGHLIEAAIAHYNLSKERRFLDAMIKYADYIHKVFVVEKSAKFKVPGHPEIELALIKLYRFTGEKRYLETAMYFIDERGYEGGNPAIQFHLPVREQTYAIGHSVRLLYLFSAVVDAYIETGDETLKDVALKLFEDVYERKMYISGGVGSTYCSEAFTIPYDLRNDNAYTETCASIALVYFASRLFRIERSSRFADCIERVIYNGLLSGVSVSGDRFFYENPLEINLDNYRRHWSETNRERYPRHERPEIFSCSCCPPNVIRFLGEIDNYIFDEADGGVYVNLFADCVYKNGDAEIVQKTRYPENGKVTIECKNVNRIYVRIPWWCQKADFDCEYTVANGYAVIDNPGNINIDFNMKPVYYEANTNVRPDNGKVALMYGPVLYCIEGVDNGDIFSVYADTDASEFDISFSGEFGLCVIEADGFRKSRCEGLYYPVNKNFEKTKIKYIPYSCFANRGESDMLVWINIAERE